jgi:2-polyprenyl-6-methoxyphenol hydroxylase-like FAD-dependent oxidoreductase
VRVLDKQPAPPAETRAIGIHARTLELFHQLGLIGEFLDRGHRVDGVVFHTGARRKVEARFARVESRYPFLLTLSQAETQRILDAKLESLGITVERGVEVVGLDEDADGVRLRVRSAGIEAMLQTRWVVGCDGARSIVRRSLGVPFDGEDYGQDWLMAEVAIDPPLRRDRFHIFAFTPSVLPCFPMPGGRWRVFMPEVPNRGVSERAAPCLEEVARLVSQRGPAGLEVSDPALLAAFRCYRRHTKVVRAGRILVAGDAAHIHSPAGGQGMNTGLQDAFNLGWKLALVAQTRAPDRLLDTYGTERVPVAAGVLTLTHALVRTFALASPPRRWVRDRVLRIASATPPLERHYVSRLAQVSQTYADSPLTVPDAGARPHRLVAGQRLPDVDGLELGGGGRVSMLDLLGRGSTAHTLLVLVAEGAEAARRFEEWDGLLRVVTVGGARCGADVIDPGFSAHRRYGMRRGGFVLIRPDGYVACRAPLNRPDIPEGYLQRLTH